MSRKLVVLFVGIFVSLFGFSVASSYASNLSADLAATSYVVGFSGNHYDIETSVSNFGPSWSMPTISWTLSSGSVFSDYAAPCPGEFSLSGNTLTWKPFNSRNCIVSAGSGQLVQIGVDTPTGAFSLKTVTRTYIPFGTYDPDPSNNTHLFAIR